MGPLGIPEMIFIFIFALVIFGPKKLPELGRTFGKGMAEFRRASNELKSTFQREMDNIERETRMDEARKAASEAKKALTEATNYYDGDDDEYYDAYGESKTPRKTVASSTTPSQSGSASSEGDSSDSASGAGTPSSESSSNGVTVAEASELPAAEPADDSIKDPAAEKGAA